MRDWSRWKQRFRAIGSPLIQTPAYRTLFVLVILGALLIATLPEAAFVLPALDAVGLDLVTIIVALELRHYLAALAPAQVVSRCRDILRTNPILWLYQSVWVLIWIRKVMGTTRI